MSRRTAYYIQHTITIFELRELYKAILNDTIKLFLKLFDVVFILTLLMVRHTVGLVLYSRKSTHKETSRKEVGIVPPLP